MTPAQVWADAYTRHYLETLAYLRAQGYDYGQKFISPQGELTEVRRYCQVGALRFAEETREAFLTENPDVIEEWIQGEA
jgi:hypothetical protein